MDENTQIKLEGIRALSIELLEKLEWLKSVAGQAVGDPDDKSSWVTDFIYDESVSPDRLWENTKEFRK